MIQSVLATRTLLATTANRAAPSPLGFALSLTAALAGNGAADASPATFDGRSDRQDAASDGKDMPIELPAPDVTIDPRFAVMPVPFAVPEPVQPQAPTPVSLANKDVPSATSTIADALPQPVSTAEVKRFAANASRERQVPLVGVTAPASTLGTMSVEPQQVGRATDATGPRTDREMTDPGPIARFVPNSSVGAVSSPVVPIGTTGIAFAAVLPLPSDKPLRASLPPRSSAVQTTSVRSVLTTQPPASPSTVATNPFPVQAAALSPAAPAVVEAPLSFAPVAEPERAGTLLPEGLVAGLLPVGTLPVGTLTVEITPASTPTPNAPGLAASLTAAPPLTTLPTRPLPIAVPDVARAVVATPALQAFAGAMRAEWKKPALGRPDEPQAIGAPAIAQLDMVGQAVAAPTATQGQTLDMRREHWPAAMIDHIETLRDAADASSTKIRVVPDALGTIDLSVKRDGDTLHVRFDAEQPTTQVLLTDAQPRLAEIAESRGLKLGETDIGGGGSGGAQQQRTPTQPALAPPPFQPAARATIAAAADDIRIA